jgi:hypothetical protein
MARSMTGARSRLEFAWDMRSRQSSSLRRSSALAVNSTLKRSGESWRTLECEQRHEDGGAEVRS